MPPQALLAVWILGLTLARASRRGKEDLLDVAQGLKSPKLTDLIGQSVMKNSYVNYYSRKENWNAFFYSKTWMPMNVSPPHPSLHVATEMMQKKTHFLRQTLVKSVWSSIKLSTWIWSTCCPIMIYNNHYYLKYVDIIWYYVVYSYLLSSDFTRNRTIATQTQDDPGDPAGQIWWKSFVHISEGYPCNLSSLSLMRSKEGTCERTRINGAKRLNQTY